MTMNLTPGGGLDNSPTIRVISPTVQDRAQNQGETALINHVCAGIWVAVPEDRPTNIRSQSCPER